MAVPSPVSTAFTDSSTGPEKRNEIVDLLRQLRVDLDEFTLLPLQRSASLEQLKVFSRDVRGSEPLYTQEAVETLSRHSFGGSSLTTSREALRCLANIFLLQPPTRQMFVDGGFASKATERLKVDNRDDEFLISRILFLMTYDTTLDFDQLNAEYQLSESITKNIERHAKRYSKSSRKASMPDPMNEMALIESLKLMFNIIHFYTHLADQFSKSILPILKMLHRTKIPTPALQPPGNYMINALTNLQLDDKRTYQFGQSPLFPKFDQSVNVQIFIKILEHAIEDYKETELDTAAAPILALIRKTYEMAPEGVKKSMEGALLPRQEERSKPLGKSDTLPSKLLRLSTSPSLPNLRTSIQAMMFELSGKDADQFVRNVGYGFAAGFLMSHGLSIPANASEAFSNGSLSTRASSESTPAINPVTGQRLDAEPEIEEPQMTDEEKEREAERLFVLFDRLKATGVVDVENPVRAAYQSGRIQELPD